MIKKSEIIETIQALPQEEFQDVDDLLREVILVAKIEKGMQDLKDGNVISEEEMDKIIEQW